VTAADDAPLSPREIRQLFASIEKLNTTIERLDERFDNRMDSERAKSDEKYVSKESGPYVREETFKNAVSGLEDDIGATNGTIRRAFLIMAGLVTGVGVPIFVGILETRGR
jgi:hypothetical protein